MTDAATLPVQRQLEACNAHDLERFVAEVVNRMVAGPVVVDHERIRTVWF